jgi:aminoglycoside N3'-acetyltransferase
MVKENSFSFNLEMLKGSEAMELYNFCLEFLRDRTLLHYSEYAFKKEVKNENGSKVIAEGFRQNFYVPPKDYQELVAIFREACKSLTVENLRPIYSGSA